MLREGDFIYDSRPTAVYRVKESISHATEIGGMLEYYMRSMVMKADFIKDFGLDPSRCASMMIGYAIALLSMGMQVGRSRATAAALSAFCSRSASVPRCA